MHSFARVKSQIITILENLSKEGKIPSGLSYDAVDVSPPREAGHGDMTTNAAMVLAAKAQMKPREIADALVPYIQNLPEVDEVTIAGPGFINMRFAPAFWQAVLADILTAGVDYGSSRIGEGRKVNVEYVSANPTGPMHVGHARGAVFGDALARVLAKAGHEVTKEYYINDAGAQIDKLADSAFLRYREACGETIEIPEGFYPGDYLVPVGQALRAEYGESLLEQERAQWLPAVKRNTLDSMMAMIRADLAMLGIHHDVFTSEQAIRDSGGVEEAVNVLDQKGLIYVGVLEPPKGKTVDDWEPRPQTLFKSTDFGDDIDRAIRKSDGSWTYITPDIAYHYDKFRRGFNQLIDVFGADHTGYVKRLKASVIALSDGKANLDVKLCQLVKFLRGGEPAKMSKRAGTFVTVRDVVEEVGKDVLRFIMLTRKNDAPLDFDFEKVMEQSKDNPVFYVQYAHARCRSLVRLAREQAPDAVALAETKDASVLAFLQEPEEMDLIKILASWPRMVEGAAAHAEPHRIAFYLGDLAAAFHAFWNLGNHKISLRFIIKDAIKLTAARLLLAQSVATIIASGLNVLGVEPVEEMR